MSKVIIIIVMWWLVEVNVWLVILAIYIYSNNIYRPPSSLVIDVGHGVLILKIRRMISG